MTRRRVYFVIPPTNTGTFQAIVSYTALFTQEEAPFVIPSTRTGTFQAIVDRPGMAWLHTNVRRGLFRVIKIERYRT